MLKRVAMLFVSLTLLPLIVSALSIGDRVTATANLNVRTTPSTSATIVGTVPNGSLGTILIGPIINSFVWWHTQWNNGLTGWSVQDYLLGTTGTLQGPTATFSANGATDITVNVGDTINYAWSSTNGV